MERHQYRGEESAEILDSWRIQPTIPTAGARGGQGGTWAGGGGGSRTRVGGHEEVGREIINEEINKTRKLSFQEYHVTAHEPLGPREPSTGIIILYTVTLIKLDDAIR